jgi:type I restriction enzyme S subunit
LNAFNYHGYVSGSTRLKLTQSNMKAIPLSIPPLPQQEKIVSVLDTASALVEKQKALLEKYDLFLKSKFIEMFGDPVKNPMGWKVVKLKDLTSKIGSGATPKGGKEAYQNEGISLIRSLNVHDNQFLYKNLAFIDDAQADGLSNVVVEQNDVLLNITGASVCRTTIVPDNVLPARVNQHVAIIRPKSNILNSGYLLHLFLSNYKQHLFHLATSGGATREALTKVDIEELDILLPPLELQKKFAQIIEQTEILKQKEQQKFEKLQTLYDALMKRAFNGEIV